ncbi:MAG TPA: rhomboid family intramembrane serine protease [Candidatus Methylomirabilis sp.]|nr:rhomboid family intramembrane serine protease [Candidatus Methylomirabilis sp.]
MFLIPIGHEDQRVARLPWVTIGLVALNVAVFLITHSLAERQSVAVQTQIREVVRFAHEHPYLRLPQELAQAIPSGRPPADLSTETIADQQDQLDRLVEVLQTLTLGSVFRTYGYIPAQPSVLTVFSSMFLHAGWLHLIGNMLFLWLAGASLEDRWGRILFPILYLASGVAAALTHQGMNWQSTIPMVGASGAIAGLMGAFLVRLATTRIRFLYWFFFFQGTFEAPAYIVLPLWLLQQFAMASQGAGNVAVWAHIGGFGLGVAAAFLIRGTDLEARFLAPTIQKKTVWTASEKLTAAMERLDHGDADGAIQALQALLRANPNSIEVRTSLIAAYEHKGDRAASGKESAKLVGAYVWARDGDGALAAAQAHDRAYRDVPLFMRDLLALATYQEKRGQHAEAAQLYQKAIGAWPDDPLTPKALLAYGRSMLDNYGDSAAALELLERARTHPKVPPEVRKASEELIAKAREAAGPEAPPPQAAPPAEPAFPEPAPPPPPAEAEVEGVPAEVAPAPQPTCALVPVPMRAVGIDARGLQLQGRSGGTGRLAWQQIAAVSVARIGAQDTAEPVVDSLVLDLLMPPKAASTGTVVRCVRLSMQDVAIPQLQAEPSPLRALQRLVATILKSAGAVPHPDRDACLGLRGFPAFPDLASYEADLVSRLPTPGA